MTLQEKAKAYHMPMMSTPEDLESRYLEHDDTILKYGDRILIASYYWSGPGEGPWVAAVYEFLQESQDVDDEVGLRTISEERFEDDGHAIAWAINAE